MVTLNPTDEAHVVAFHEAGHAAAIDRLGLRLRALRIRDWGDAGHEGECTHAGQSEALSGEAIEANNRVIYLAGVAAEIAFTGTTDTDECEQDCAQAARCSAYLGDDPDSARVGLMARLADAFGHADMRKALDETAALLLERREVTDEGLQEVHDIFATRLGKPGAAWP